MMFLWIFLIIPIGYAIWYFGNGRDESLIAGNKNGNAIEILKIRFAQGEIDKQEFEERKTMLEEDDF